MCEEDHAQGLLCRRLQVQILNRYRLTELNVFSDISLKSGTSLDPCTNDPIVLKCRNIPWWWVHILFSKYRISTPEHNGWHPGWYPIAVSFISFHETLVRMWVKPTDLILLIHAKQAARMELNLGLWYFITNGVFLQLLLANLPSSKHAVNIFFF